MHQFTARVRVKKARIQLRSWSNDKTDAAFTLIELAVILGMLGVLSFLLTAPLLRNSSQIKRAQCASNLQQFTLAMQIFANENDDKFPTNSVGFWAWDTPWAVGTFVESTGSKWSVMYCPGTSPRFSETLNSQLYNYVPPSFRVLGYANTLPGSAGVSATNQNATLSPAPPPIGPSVLPTPLPADRVLLADATISEAGQNNESLRSTYNYTQIPGGFSPVHVSAHLNGKLPAGGNLGMLDGHVAWRKFAEMHVRSPNSGSPTFWW